MSREALKPLREALNLSNQTPIKVKYKIIEALDIIESELIFDKALKGKLPDALCHIHAYNEWTADCVLCVFDKKEA